METFNGEQQSAKFKADLFGSTSSKSAMSISLSLFGKSTSETFIRSQDDFDILTGSKPVVTLTSSTSMPNLSELNGADGVQDVGFWAELDMGEDFFEDMTGEMSSKKQTANEKEAFGVADDRFGASPSIKRKLPPRLDKEHFNLPPSSRSDSGGGGQLGIGMRSASLGTSSRSSRMDTSSSAEKSVRASGSSSMSMSTDSRDTMAELARRIEPVNHDNVEFTPLDLTLSEELHLHLSSSYSMSVDERLVKHSSNNTTPHSTMKSFDYPESFSMSSWSQHTISQDVFGPHHVARVDPSFSHEQLHHSLDGNELWSSHSVELDLLGSHDSYGGMPVPTLMLNHNRRGPQHQHNNNYNPNNNNSNYYNNYNNNSNNINYAHHPPQHYPPPHHPMNHHPPAHPPSHEMTAPAQRGPRPPLKGRNMKPTAERGSIGELEEVAGGDAGNQNPQTGKTASVPLDDMAQEVADVLHQQVAEQQYAPPAVAMYSYPTAFQQQSRANSLVVHTNSPASPHGSVTLSPTHYINGAPLAPLYDPATGVVYYPQLPPQGSFQGHDPAGGFFAKSAPGVQIRSAASQFRVPASGSPVAPLDSPVFDTSISATMHHGTVSANSTPTGSQSKSSKDKKEKNRGNYRCGRCGKPKVNHVCEFVDAITVSQAVQAKGVVLNPHTMQPFSGDRVIAVNLNRKSIQDHDKTFADYGMKSASDSFNLGRTTIESLSVKSGASDTLQRSSSNFTVESSLLNRTSSNNSDIFDSLSRSGDESPYPPREVMLSPRSRPTVAFKQPVSNNQTHGQGGFKDLAQAQLSSESDDVFFPTEYPPGSRENLVMSSRNSSVNSTFGNESDSSSTNGDSILQPRPSAAGSMFPDFGLSKFFQFGSSS